MNEEEELVAHLDIFPTSTKTPLSLMGEIQVLCLGEFKRFRVSDCSRLFIGFEKFISMKYKSIHIIGTNKKEEQVARLDIFPVTTTTTEDALSLLSYFVMGNLYDVGFHSI